MNFHVQFVLLMLANLGMGLAGWALVGILFPIMWCGSSFAFGAMWLMYRLNVNPTELGMKRIDETES